ncbi:hypothetical protein AABB24_018181 [Solanum stoloniferum]|uniref:Uncharacterized protein n=1 Tax=Solanum stoloniferum TaxID=62892 RepID=A0ABD2TC88_9SOLN
MHYWVRASPADFAGAIPQPRSGHTAVNIGKSKVVVFGGLIDKKFLSDITVYDIENKLWFQPECTGSGSDGQVGPCPRAFHAAVAIDCHMFIFGGRSGGRRLGDFWVLDTAASAIGNSKIVMFGGWDGKKWLSDVYILDTMTLEWRELAVLGAIPPPRCGHTATMVEKRLLVYGGRGGGGPIMAGLWALKGLIEEENESPGWTQLKIPGQAPTARCGHTVTSGGLHLLLFGGHGTGGWLSRYDVYYNDCVVLDRVSVQWKRLATTNEPPVARAYHSMTSIGSRYLLFGGFDGKSTYGDLWWLVPEDDPIAKRVTAPPPKAIHENQDASMTSMEKERQMQEDAVSELQKRIGISVSISNPNAKKIVDELEDTELLELASKFIGEGALSNKEAVQALRDHWSKSSPKSIQLKELSPLLRDYKRCITLINEENLGAFLQSMNPGSLGKETCRFYHIKNVSQLRMDDIPHLLAEYRQLLLDLGSS